MSSYNIGDIYTSKTCSVWRAIVTSVNPPKWRCLVCVDGRPYPYPEYEFNGRLDTSFGGSILLEAVEEDAGKTIPDYLFQRDNDI